MLHRRRLLAINNGDCVLDERFTPLENQSTTQVQLNACNNDVLTDSTVLKKMKNGKLFAEFKVVKISTRRNLTKEKRSSYTLKLVAHSKNTDENVEIYLLVNIDIDDLFLLINHGSDQVAKLGKKLSEAKPSIIRINSIWLTTYCFTIYEVQIIRYMIDVHDMRKLHRGFLTQSNSIVQKRFKSDYISHKIQDLVAIND